MADFVGAVDQGTTSTRFMVFDHDGAEVGRHQLEHEQVMPQAGWVEHNPLEIWERTQTVIGSARGHPIGNSWLRRQGWAPCWPPDDNPWLGSHSRSSTDAVGYSLGAGSLSSGRPGCSPPRASR